MIDGTTTNRKPPRPARPTNPRAGRDHIRQPRGYAMPSFTPRHDRRTGVNEATSSPNNATTPETL